MGWANEKAEKFTLTSKIEYIPNTAEEVDTMTVKLITAELEKAVGDALNDASISKEQAVEVILNRKLSMSMVHYWQGRAYEREQKASNGYQ